MKTNPDLERDLVTVWTRIREAMVAGDPARLRELLAEDFTLGHMSGRRQPRDEWLDEIASGVAVYHSIRDVKVDVEPDDEAAPVLVARTVTDATLAGAHGTWQTGFTVGFRREGTRWRAVRADGFAW